MLHWLPVRQRVHYKLLLFTYKAITGLAPDYSCDLVSVKQANRTLRSADHTTLVVPSSRLKSYGDSAFCVAAPILWNQLPNTLKAVKSLELFKSRLKTHLFKIAFDSSH